jgi:hypothetical protein
VTTTSSVCVWTGVSGRPYAYHVHALAGSIPGGPGNFVVAKRSGKDEWTAILVGQADDIARALDDPGRRSCIRREGATHLHVRSNEDREARLSEQTDLAWAHRPCCNGLFP